MDNVQTYAPDIDWRDAPYTVTGYRAVAVMNESKEGGWVSVADYMKLRADLSAAQEHINTLHDEKNAMAQSSQTTAERTSAMMDSMREQLAAAQKDASAEKELRVAVGNVLIKVSNDLAAATLRADAAQEELRKVREQVSRDYHMSDAEWVYLAIELCEEEGHDPHELIYDGGYPPEPWGEKFYKYEEEAKRMIALVRKHAAPVPAQPQPVVMRNDHGCIHCMRLD